MCRVKGTDMSTSEGYQALSRGGSYARQKYKFSADYVTYLRGMPDERAQKDQKVSQARRMYHQMEKKKQLKPTKGEFIRDVHSLSGAS